MENEIGDYFLNRRLNSAVALGIVVFCGLLAAGLIINRLYEIKNQALPFFLSPLLQELIEE